MDLNTKALLFFVSILLIIAFCAWFPSAMSLGIGILVGSFLIVYQTIVILKDNS